MDKPMDFRDEFINKIRLASLDGHNFEEEEFFSEVSELLEGAGILDNIEYSPYRNSTRGMRVDGYAWNELEKTLNVIVSKYSGDESVPTLTQTELEKLAGRVGRFIENLGSDSFLESLEVSSDREVADQLLKFLPDTHKIRLVIYSDYLLSNRVKKIKNEPILDKPTTVEVWAIDRIESLSQADGEGEPFTVDFVGICGGLEVLPANTSEHGTKTFLCVVPGNVLSTLYDEYGQRLLEANVRTFLDFRSGVNKGIRKALLTEPENFFAYNNGLTCTATDIKLSEQDGQFMIQSLENLQIVNGGQTTASIYFAPREKGGIGNYSYRDIDLTKVFVQMKLTVISNADILDEMKSNISEYANTQNSIQKSDLVSNHPFHRNIEKLALSTSMPAVNGVSTKWFYERSRGQYNTRLRPLTAAKQRQFKAEFPTSQKFSKTDMAKYENTWRMRPFEVKKGAQANLKLLGARIAEEFEQDEDNFKHIFYRELIAKAILFKEADSAIFTSNWYREQSGFKAETVTYTLSFLRHLLLKKGEDLNLDRIFRTQSISEELRAEIVNLGLFIRERILDPEFRNGVANPSEFCKSAKGWERIKRLEYALRYLSSADVLSSSQQKEAAEETKELKAAGHQIDDFEAISKITEGEWRKIIEFYISQGYPPFHKNVTLSEKCLGIRSGKTVPTDNEMKAALQIRKRAYDQGFDYAD
ncbi:AIPR family protein [Pseudidiomarina sp. E22-M8]|uniref:AIPR family protein n=1 Tax=Pseudidiomarina sp. E22-M8 TaxID=3424768 RepID=UPI00403C93AA